MNGTTPTYHYYIQDHQGNSRVVFNQNGTIEQTNHHYPFGMTFGEEINNSDQRYKYNGKELDRMHGLDLYDYGARHYDAAIGRWGVIDPLAEKYYSVSPYTYCTNNPIRFIDPNGEEIWIYNYDKDGSLVDKIRYKPGMEYKGDNAFISNAVSVLNKMNSVEIIGSQVLSTLYESKSKYDFTNLSSSSDGGIKFKKDGGAVFKMGENPSLSVTAHELFHGYQAEKGDIKSSIENELEAYAYSYAVSYNYASKHFSDRDSQYFLAPSNVGRMRRSQGVLFNEAFNRLIDSKSLNSVDFKKALDSFKRGSLFNLDGIYNKLPLGSKKTNLLKSFYPLIR